MSPHARILSNMGYVVQISYYEFRGEVQCTYVENPRTLRNARWPDNRVMFFRGECY